MSLRWIWFTLGSVQQCSPSLFSFHSFFTSVALRGGAAGFWHWYAVSTCPSSDSYLSGV